MTVYIDSDYRCHKTDDGTRRAFDLVFFDGKCSAYINGYRFIPHGESWTREDGVTFVGETCMICGNIEQMKMLQAQYEEDMAEVADMVQALAILGVTE